MRSSEVLSSQSATRIGRCTGRITVYLREMYPIPQRTLYAIVLSAGVGTLLETVTSNAVRFSLRGLWLGAFTTFCFALILRLMDELKDREIDRALFPHRPLPSGRILKDDIVGLLVGAVVLYLGVHIGAGSAIPGVLVLLAYGGLMFRYFFLPSRCHEMLLPNLITHNPVTAVLLFALVALFTLNSGGKAGEPTWRETALVIAYFWPPVLGWELARKIRYPREETEYVTYSRLFGPAGAIAIAGGVQMTSLLIGLGIALRYGMSPVFPVMIGTAALLLMRSYLRFGRGQLGSGVELKAAAERYAVLVMAAPIVERLWEGVIDRVA